ncbi:MAG: acetyl ornithine aminotransferase family protein [Anaerolineae bacterium]|nr:acetyl ornithine aminotransferase family protein [Anaerolineae bacterium]
MKTRNSTKARLRANGPRIITPPPGPKAKKLLARDKKVVSHSYPRDYPFVMDRGIGAQVWDVDRNRYIDWMAGIAVNATGHSHPKLVKALQEQAEKFLHISSDFYHESMIRLGERINEIAPMQEDVGVFYCNSGTEAVEAAIKLARYATKRQRFIGFLGAFHGRSMGSLSFTASKHVQQERFFPTMPGVVHVPFPNPFRPVLELHREGDYGDTVVDYIERVIFQTILPPEECAAILLEPIQGEGGYIVPPQNFFPRLREMCDKHGIILIADEVQSGVGRTGKWWAIENWNVEPDIVCSAKGIASGLPLGLMFARQSIMKKWVPGAHGNTYGGNPLACAAALTTLELVENGMMANAIEQGEFIMDALAEMQMRHPSIGDVRGLGLMIGVEFVQDKTSRQPAQQLREEVVRHAFQNGLLLLGCGRSTIRIAPPLMIERPLVEEGLELFEAAVTSAEKKHKLL